MKKTKHRKENKMKKIITFSLLLLLSTTLLAQNGWDNWKPYSSESYYDVKDDINGKEKSYDYNIYNPKFYKSKIQNRFLTVDRFADKYPMLSPYVYCANNPMIFTDATGDTIDLLPAQRTDQAMGTNNVNTLVSDLQSKTGLSLSVNQKGQLVYATDKNGNPVIATDKNGNPIGSQDARNLITGAVGNSNTVSVFQVFNKGSQGLPNNTLGLNPNQINSFISGASSGLNSTTLGWGMTFMHELSHTPVGGGLHDPKAGSPIGATGAVVNNMNTILSQLGTS